MDDFTRYEHYYALLEYRKAEPRERLIIFRSTVVRTVTTLSGFTDVLRFEGNENTLSEALTEACQRLSDLCASLQKLSNELKIEDGESETTISEKLIQVSDYEYFAGELRILSSLIDRQALPQSIDAIFWSEQLLKYANFLEANWEVLINSAEPNIPSEVREAHEFHMKLRHGDIGNPDHRTIVLNAATHPFYEIRKDAAVLLRHYDDQSSLAALISLLADENEEVVAWTSNSLGNLQKREAVPSLISTLNRKFENQAYLGWIAEALSNMPDEAALDPPITQLNSLVHGSVEGWQTQVLPIAGFRKAIASIGGEKAKKALKEYFNDPEI